MNMTDIDPYIFFAVMFGSSDAVQLYIGELWIANKADSLLKESHMMNAAAMNGKDKDDPSNSSANKSPEELRREREQRMNNMMQTDKFKQRKREVMIARNIRQRIQSYVQLQEEEHEFVISAQAEAADICKSAFGHTFCTTIGTALELEATEFLGYSTSGMFSLEANVAKLKGRMNTLSSNVRVMGAGMSALRAGTQAIKEVESVQKQLKSAKEKSQSSTGTTPPGEENILNSEQTKETMEKLQHTLPVFLELAWAINTRDISKTLQQVCFKLFHDSSVTSEERVKRAQAIRILGREFYAIGKATQDLLTTTATDSSTNATKAKAKATDQDIEDIKTRAEVGAIMTLAKAQGQDITEQDAKFLIQQQKMMKAQQQQQQKTSEL